jgi:hypothetical protein
MGAVLIIIGMVVHGQSYPMTSASWYPSFEDCQKARALMVLQIEENYPPSFNIIGGDMNQPTREGAIRFVQNKTKCRELN